MLDERGHKITSQGFADLLANVRQVYAAECPACRMPQMASIAKCSERGVQAGDNGASSLVFCIGGPYGHAASIRDRADSVISLSSLVSQSPGTFSASAP